jgi:hypothetical protein
MRNDIHGAMKREGYTARQRSKWIGEAIGQLCRVDYFPELIAEDYIGPGRNTPIRITVEGDIVKEMLVAIERAKNEESLTEVQSKLVRTAIHQRLIREGLQ